jgi:hypothetical protein
VRRVRGLRPELNSVLVQGLTFVFCSVNVEKGPMNHFETINEPIETLVVYKKGRTIPYLFKWHGRSYRIEKINLVHTDAEGESRIFYFSVSTSSGAYKLRFDSSNLEWQLAEIYPS